MSLALCSSWVVEEVGHMNFAAVVARALERADPTVGDDDGEGEGKGGLFEGKPMGGEVEVAELEKIEVGTGFDVTARFRTSAIAFTSTATELTIM